MRVVFIHGACVRDGAWWWSRVATLLRAADVESVAVALPSCGETGVKPGTSGAGFAEDVVAVRRVVEDGEPAVVVAHSYGGVLATEAGATARHLVYITSFLPDVGESLASFGTGSPAAYLDFSRDGTFGVRTEMAQDLFLHDCDDAAVAGAFARLIRQTANVGAQPVTQAAWKTVPSTYLVCADDRATAPDLQRRQAKRAGRTVELPTGHHPFLSHPELVARAITDLQT